MNYQRISRKQLERMNKENKLIVEENQKLKTSVSDLELIIRRMENEGAPSKDLEMAQALHKEADEKIAELKLELEDIKHRIPNLEQEVKEKTALIIKLEKEIEKLNKKGNKNGTGSGNKA